MERAAPHVVRDLGRKLADDAGGAAIRAIAFLSHPHDHAEVVDIGMSALVGILLPALAAAYPEFTREQAGEAVVDSVRRLVDQALAASPTTGHYAPIRVLG